MPQAERERRREPRALTAALIQIRDEYEEESTCVLEDVSYFGACIHSDVALEVGVKVKLKTSSVVHAGVVKHCKLIRGEGYSIGIAFADAQWPTPIAFPIHWIAPDRK